MKKLLLSLSLSLLMVPGLFADNKPADEPELSSDAISQTLSPEELAVIDRNEEPYVYLSMDVISCLKSLPSLKDMPEEVKALQEHVHHYKSYPYDHTLNAVREAIEYLEAHPKVAKAEDHLKSLREYQDHLNSGEAIVVSVMDENATRRRSKCKRFCRLIVQDCLKAASICVVGDVNVGGNVNVRNNVNVGGTVTACDLELTCPCDTTKTLRIPRNVEVCGTLSACDIEFLNNADCPCDLTQTFEIPQNLSVAGTITQNVGCNGTGTGLFLKGGVESLLRNIRGTVDLSGITVSVTLSLMAPLLTIALDTTTVTKLRPAVGGGWSVGPATLVDTGAGSLGALGAVLAALGADIEVALGFDVTFDTPFAFEPSIVLGLETTNPTLTPLPGALDTLLGAVAGLSTGLVNNLTASISNVTTSGFRVGITASLLTIGLAVNIVGLNVEAAVNNILGGLRVNFIAEAPVAPAA